MANIEFNHDERRLIGKIDGWLFERQGKLHNVSSIARGVKAPHAEVNSILRRLDAAGMFVIGEGNGCWRKYTTR